jgi:hypothetical protein
VAVAPPPGTIRPTALPASCEQATANQSRVRSAIRLSSQIATKLAASNAAATTTHGHSRCPSEPADEKTAARLGSRR